MRDADGSAKRRVDRASVGFGAGHVDGAPSLTRATSSAEPAGPASARQKRTLTSMPGDGPMRGRTLTRPAEAFSGAPVNHRTAPPMIAAAPTP